MTPPISILWSGHTAIHLGQHPWSLRRQEAIERRDFKTGVFDQLVNPAVHIAAGADDLLNRIEEILAPRDLRIIAAPMFEEDKPAFRFQRAANFGQSRGDVRDRAQSHRGHDRIERVIVERQPPLRVETHPRHWNPAGCDTRDDPIFQHILRINRGQLCHSFRIVRQIQSRAEADFKRLAPRGLQRAATVFAEFGRAQTPIEQPWKDVFRVKTHWGEDRTTYLRHSTGNMAPAFSGGSSNPAIAAARVNTGSRLAARSAAVGSSNSSGVTPTPSRLLPSAMITSASVTLTP